MMAKQRIKGIAQALLRATDNLLQALPVSSPSLMCSRPGAIHQWINACKDAPEATSGPTVGVYMFRNGFWVSHGVYTASRLRLMGCKPVLFYSEEDLEQSWLGRSSNLRNRYRQNLLARLHETHAFQTEMIDHYLPADLKITSATVDKHRQSAQILAAYERESMGTPPEEALRGAVEKLLRYKEGIQSFQAERGLNRAVVPNGAVGSTAGIFQGLRDTGVDVVTIDSWGQRSGHLLWNLNQPTTEPDYGSWFETLGQLAPQQKRVVEDFMRFQEDPSHNDDAWEGYRPDQRVPTNRSLPDQIQDLLGEEKRTALLGTNCVGDSAVLGRETIFEDQIDWLRETIRWFRERPDRNLIVRIHPHEDIHDVDVQLGDYAAEFIGGAPNIELIEPSASLNTFSLTEHLDLGIVWVSSLGVDLAARGIPTISAARPPYGGLEVAEVPESVTEYLSAVERVLLGSVDWGQEQRETAQKALYVKTRLLSLPGGHHRKPSLARFKRLSSDLDGQDQLIYDIMAGFKGRHDALRRAVQEEKSYDARGRER